MTDFIKNYQDSRRAERANRLRDINVLIDEAAAGNFSHVVTVGQFAELMQERNAILLQMEAESARKLATPLERQVAEYEHSHSVAIR